MTIDEAIKHCEEVATGNEKTIAYYSIQGDKEWLDECEKDCIECAKDHRQLAEWLRELQRYRFEISECKAILDNPTPDVTENDKKRAMYVLQTFPDVRGE